MFNNSRTPRSHIVNRATRRLTRHKSFATSKPFKAPPQPQSFQPASSLPMTPVTPKGPGYDS